MRTIIQLAIAMAMAVRIATPAFWTASIVDLQPESAGRSILSGCTSPNGNEPDGTSRLLADVHCKGDVSSFAQKSIIDPTSEISKPGLVQQTPMSKSTPDRLERPPKREEQN